MARAIIAAVILGTFTASAVMTTYEDPEPLCLDLCEADDEIDPDSCPAICGEED